VDDHVLVRQGLRILLESEDDFIVVGEAQDGLQAVEMAGRLSPDVVVMDLAMPLRNGLEATRQIVAAAPTMRVLVLSGHDDGECVEQVRSLGALGYVTNRVGFVELAEAILTVWRGRAFFLPSIPGCPPGQNGGAAAARLTPREAEVLHLIALSMANKQTAARLGISIKTVEKHRQSLMTKLDIHDVAGLTRHAIRVGSIEA
jgi:DNA-binding NarL/FixJ family response regulator